jgi:hypothetical protein
MLDRIIRFLMKGLTVQLSHFINLFILCFLYEKSEVNMLLFYFLVKDLYFCLSYKYSSHLFYAEFELFYYLAVELFPICDLDYKHR